MSELELKSCVNPYSYERMLALFVGLMFPITLWLFSAFAINSPKFWYDEAGQFWISLGLNHFSPLNSPIRGWAEMWRINHSGYNLDPGGFTAILREWIFLFGTSPLALRLLPFLFFLTCSLFCSLTGYLIFSSRVFAAACLYLPLFFPGLLHYAFELRAFSMECAGVACSSFLLLRALRYNRILDSVSLGFSLLFFTFSRYTFVVVSASICATWLIINIGRDFGKPRVWIAPLFALFGVFLAYFLSLRFQAPTGDPPNYILPFLLKGKSVPEWIDFFRVNFLSFPGYFLIVLVGLAFFIERKKTEFQSFSSAPFVTWFSIFIGIFHLFSIILSALGKLPWHIHGRWNIAIPCICLVAAIIGTGFIAELIFRFFPRILKFTLAAGGFATVILSVYYSLWFNRHFQNHSDVAVAPLINNQTLIRPLFVSTDSSPVLRYLFEYGPYREVDRSKLRILTRDEESSLENFFNGVTGSFSVVISEGDTQIRENYLSTLRILRHGRVSTFMGGTIRIDIEGSIR